MRQRVKAAFTAHKTKQMKRAVRRVRSALLATLQDVKTLDALVMRISSSRRYITRSEWAVALDRMSSGVSRQQALQVIDTIDTSSRGMITIDQLRQFIYQTDGDLPTGLSVEGACISSYVYHHKRIRLHKPC